MKNNSVIKLGGTCSIFVGISFLVIGATYFLLPPEQRSGSTEAFLRSFAANPGIQKIQYWAWALGALFALAAVPAVSEIVRSANEGWVRWTSTLAQLGFAVTAVSYFTILEVQPVRAANYVCNQCQQTVIQPALVANQDLLGLDPQQWLSSGAVGVWIFVVSLLALRGGAWPRPLAYVGIGLAVVSWLLPIANVINPQLLVPIVAALGGIVLGPIWFIWMGWRLRSSQ